ncbi:quinol monooxygenase YgiN [Metapseudomonas resinovorans]
MSKNPSITIVAYLKARDGMDEALLLELRNLVHATQAETGCVQYILHRSVEAPKDFMIYEIWRDQAALNDHVLQAHYLQFSALAGELLVEPPIISQMIQIA